MSNNILERLAQMSTPDIKRANWNEDFTNTGTNDFGFMKVKFCQEIIANSRVTLDFKSAYSTNPTISPILSKARVRVTAIWVPISLYVPAARDNVEFKPGETDYAFPTINFSYSDIRQDYLRDKDVAKSMNQVTELNLLDVAGYLWGHGYEYIPHGSIYSELGMWKPNFQPLGFANMDDTPENYPGAKNAIPLLGYYDFYRTYVLNSQDNKVPLRSVAWAPGVSYEYSYGGSTLVADVPAQAAMDRILERSDFDNFFKRVRKLGAEYPMGDGSFDITPALRQFSGAFPKKNVRNRDILLDNHMNLLDAAAVEPVAVQANHFGELRDTYSGDQFTAFLSNENVEYERSTARVKAKVDENNEVEFTMETIYSAQKVQNYVRRSVFKNNGYSDFIEAQYDITPPTNLSHPLFLGSVTTDLYWNDVVSQTQSGDDNDIESNTSLGSRAGLGYGRMVTGSYRGKNERPFISFTAKEPGYLMLIESIVPDVSYFQTYNPQYDKLTIESLYFPSFDKDGYQDKQFKHLCEQPEFTNFARMPYSITYDELNVAYAQEPAYFEHMAKHDVMSGQMVEAGVYRHWVFSRQGYTNSQFDDVNSSLTFPRFVQKMTTTYVTPEPYNKIFANENGLDNFQTFYSFDFKLYQPLSHRFLSFK